MFACSQPTPSFVRNLKCYKDYPDDLEFEMDNVRDLSINFETWNGQTSDFVFLYFNISFLALNVNPVLITLSPCIHFSVWFSDS